MVSSSGSLRFCGVGSQGVGFFLAATHLYGMVRGAGRHSVSLLALCHTHHALCFQKRFLDHLQIVDEASRCQHPTRSSAASLRSRPPFGPPSRQARVLSFFTVHHAPFHLDWRPSWRA
eukprot:scaffold24_cov341-Pavlova_lutheri.AAC.45